MTPVPAEFYVASVEEPFACNESVAYRKIAKLYYLLPIAAGESHDTRYDFVH